MPKLALVGNEICVAYFVALKSCIFFSRKNTEDFVDDCYKREAYLKVYSGSIPPYVGERHWSRIEKQLNPPFIKIGSSRLRKNRIKIPMKTLRNIGN